MNLLVTALVKAHHFVFKATNGRLGSRLGPQKILLLKHVGRHSGRDFETPLSYYRDGDRYLVVASNWGKENHPHWFLNLMARPLSTIRLKDELIEVEATEAKNAEHDRLWVLVSDQNRQYLKYQEGLKRRIPIVILTPVSRN